MVDPIDSLAMSVYHGPGIYALLLGSGVSRSANIPTGYEVTLNLIRELAKSVGDDCEPDPEAWYSAKYGQSADYSNILEEVAKSQPERSIILRPYFDLTAAEREEAMEGLKLPTEAHKRIANLVASGYIRVILTTNFDSLLEQALDALSVRYQVISSLDSISAALPLAHSGCTIIKVNGDYKDARIRNTVQELSAYEKPMNRLLRQVFEEYGLVVSGWSADYDIALGKALLNCPKTRFSTYWCLRGDPRDAAKPLIDHRNATILPTPSADAFFQKLEEKVIALRDLEKEQPPTANMATATLKRYLREDRYEIRLHDFVADQVEKLYECLNRPNTTPTAQEILKLLQYYEEQSQIMLAIMIAGCYWSREEQDQLWAQVLERFGNQNNTLSGPTVWIDLLNYPALLLFYAGGIAALKANRYHTFRTLLVGPRFTAVNRYQKQPAVLSLAAHNVLKHDVANAVMNVKKSAKNIDYYAPASEHLFEVLREPLRSCIPGDDDYAHLFDRFEYLVSLIYADLSDRLGRRLWTPIGRFAYRERLSSDGGVAAEVKGEVERMGENWPLFSVGLLLPGLARYAQLAEVVEEQMRRFV